jgi:hypothetical protein
MAKKSMLRIATVDERLSSLVDRGFEVDVLLKNLGTEATGTKKILGEEGTKLLQDGEKAVKLSGNVALATISTIEKYEIDASHEKFPVADAAIRSGAFSDAVKVTRTLAIAPEKVEEACELLQKAGFSVMVQTSYDIDPEEFRVLTDSTPSSPQSQQAVDALKACAVKKTTTRVGFEKKS